MTFENGETQEITNSLTLNGAASNLLSLVSDSATNAWFINTTGASVSLDYLSVTDSTSTIELIPTNSEDGGRNTNWSFGKDFSGILYSGEGVSPLEGKTIAISVNGAVAAATDNTDGSGAYALENVEVEDGDIILIYVDGETEKACLVTVISKEDLSGLDLYQNRVIVRYDYTGASLTNANLLAADNGDSDLLYSVSGSDLTLGANQELFVWSGDTYVPGGNVTTTHLDIRGALTAGSNTFTLSGNFNNQGTFTANASTVTFNDNTQASIISGSTTFYKFNTTTAGKTLTFTRTTTQTITNMFTLTGTAASAITINDTGSGALPKITLSAGCIQSISNATVTNNDASGGLELIARDTSSLTNTTNWVLGSVGTDITWTGGTSTDWNDSTNWDKGIMPSESDEATISAAGFQPIILSANTTLGGLTVDPSAELSTQGNTLTVNGATVLNGTLNTGISTVTITGNVTAGSNGAIEGTTATVSIGGYVGTRQTPIAINYTGTITLGAGGMDGFTSISVNVTGGNCTYADNIPGLVYQNNDLRSHIGQAGIRERLRIGDGIFHPNMMRFDHNMDNFMFSNPIDLEWLGN
ncbi:MAG: hypothetical protein ABH848_02240 [Candidatus Omnitrophota bacterium]